MPIYQTCLGNAWRQSSLGDDSISFNGPSGTSIILAIYEGLSFDTRKISNPSLMVYSEAKPAPVDPATLQALEKPQNICSGLQKVIEATSSQFTTISRGKIGPKQTAKATVNLSGFSSCYLATLGEKPEARYYTCYLGPMGMLDAAKMNADLSGEVSDCLGKEWSLDRTKRRDGSVAYEWSKENLASSVELRSSKNSDSTWDIKIDVNLTH